MKNVLNKCKNFFIFAGIFSFVYEMLMLMPTIYMMQVFDRVMQSRSLETLLMLTLIGVFTLCIATCLDNVRSRLLTRAAVRIQSLLGPTVLEEILKVRKDDQERRHSLEDVNALQGFLTGGSIKAFLEIPWIPIYLLVLYVFHPFFMGIALIGAVILFLLTYVDEKITVKNQKSSSATLRTAADFINMSLRNVEAVQAMHMQENVVRRWWDVNKKYLHHSVASTNRTRIILSLSKFTRNIIQICAIGGAAFLVIHEGLTPGVTIASTLIMGRALGPIEKLIATWKSFINVRGAYGRLAKILEATQSSTTQLQLPRPQGELSVENILFYLSKERDILRGLNFKLGAGESLGVIGPSASGKTSLARLLVGLHQPTDGHIRMDGADIYQWAQQGLGHYMGYLPQNIELFAGTIAENIARMGDAKLHAKAIVQAAKQARIHDMILRLPRGYNTEIGEAGGILSGGQRQLIGLARALFGGPKLLVLDEPNSNMDGSSELALLDIFKDLKEQGTTLVVITHKPSLLRNIDKILVLKQGRQEKFGPRQEVMSQASQDQPQVRLLKA